MLAAGSSAERRTPCTATPIPTHPIRISNMPAAASIGCSCPVCVDSQCLRGAHTRPGYPLRSQPKSQHSCLGGGDINVHSTFWNEQQPADQRGELVADWLHSQNTSVLKEGPATCINRGTGGLRTQQQNFMWGSPMHVDLSISSKGSPSS